MFLEPGRPDSLGIAYSGLGGFGRLGGLVVGLLAAAGATTAAGASVAEGGDGEGGNDEDELLHDDIWDGWVLIQTARTVRAVVTNQTAKNAKGFLFCKFSASAAAILRAQSSLPGS